MSYGQNSNAGKYCNIRGFKMYYEVYGNGKPLLMIHGNGGSISAFEKNIGFFSKKYKVIAADSRSQGKSKDESDSLSFEMMADDEAALLDSLHIDSAFVIGWSDGGITALLMAIRHPNRVLKLASTGANLWPDSTAIIPSLWKEEKETFEKEKDKARETFKEKNDWKLFLLDWLQPHISPAQLSAIHCPSLIIGGDDDLIRREHLLQISQSIPQSFLWILPHSGHGTLQQHSDEFNIKVDAFFSGNKSF